jgi:broad specificity phosphatase PhoE
MPPSLTWLIRHGESTANAGLPSISRADAPLTERGMEQAQAMVRIMPRRPDLLISSAASRARATAGFVSARWPDVVIETWPIQEFYYLSTIRCLGTTLEQRRPFVQTYWEQCDPDYLDGDDAESFAALVRRLRDFHARLLALNLEFVAVAGHGQFFTAYSLMLKRQLDASSEGMRRYRRAETANPLRNGEVLSLTADDLVNFGELR